MLGISIDISIMCADTTMDQQVLDKIRLKGLVHHQSRKFGTVSTR